MRWMYVESFSWLRNSNSFSIAWIDMSRYEQKTHTAYRYPARFPHGYRRFHHDGFKIQPILPKHANYSPGPCLSCCVPLRSTQRQCNSTGISQTARVTSKVSTYSGWKTLRRCTRPPLTLSTTQRPWRL